MDTPRKPMEATASALRFVIARELLAAPELRAFIQDQLRDVVAEIVAEQLPEAIREQRGVILQDIDQALMQRLSERLVVVDTARSS